MALLNYITRIQFEPGARTLLGDELSQLKVRRPLIVSDHGVRDCGVLDTATASIGDVEQEYFLETPPNPTDTAVMAALQVYQQHRADGIIAIGGGSAIDLAKALGVAATNPAPLRQYSFHQMGVAPLPNMPPPLVAVPTTAGTGSEVGGGSIINFSGEDKVVIASPSLVPAVAICDPELTIGLPPSLTAATGLDAISHCVETFLSPRFNPVADAIALDGMVRAMRSIRRAVSNGANDIDARSDMMMASVQGALCFQKGLGAVHAISHPLGLLGLHHGTLNSILLPHVLRFNEGYVGDKYDRMRSALGLGSGTDLAELFAGLSRDLGIVSNLTELGVNPQDIEFLPPKAMRDAAHATNPRKATLQDYQQLFSLALG